MDWNSPFVVFRISDDGKLTEVFQTDDLKTAKYWLTYIAQPGDVLCKTPLHAKHSKLSSDPEYWSHKEKSGTPLTRPENWKKWAESKQCDASFVLKNVLQEYTKE